MQPEQIAEILTNQPVVLGSLVAVGLIMCFVGYRIFNLYSAAMGFLVGLLAGIYFVMNFFGEYPLAVILITAVATAVVFGLVYEIGLVITGAAFGYFVGLYVLPHYTIYAYVLALLFGLVNLFLERAVTVIITTVIGASFITLATFMGISGMHIYDVLGDPRGTFDALFSNVFMLLLWLSLFITGIITQLAVYKGEREEKEA